MATTTTSPTTSDVANWAYQYSLACAKLTSAQNKASSSATRSADITTAQADFNATMKSLVPAEAQSSVQFQYFDALTAYNTNLGAATSQAQRQAATDSLNTALGGITVPATTTTLADVAAANAAQAASAAADLKAMASNAGAAWVSDMAGRAHSFNAASAATTAALASRLSSLGLDPSGLTAPAVSVAATSAFTAATAAAATGGSAGSIMNAALVGSILAEQAAPVDSSG
ncbi:hypothetical protein DFW101_1915 [Solidesulfovibrio carbinoliphilus subsp. oakridgensis]|uniref:Uncharacterized protein n=1 Tax=Solidesulfovibrio carbinoliphilus subsp. oakridgensis TaxID=694327 RepID=G7Q4Z4_9BACT|nr:hypothetical protein [Solidesulfovibrio carbinoliphilus]EHJ47921.1 hypothetical protein DFW101_1915 [Solidesulfovibrio carbinoliphilus subsp. oakridgensis]